MDVTMHQGRHGDEPSTQNSVVAASSTTHVGGGRGEDDWMMDMEP
jgi:hypothetical protein